MNDDASFRELSQIADSIVRPVIASGTRKRRMREELLAHLLEAFEQELARHPSESGEPGLCEREAALRATLARFGAPEELTSQLQQVAAQQDPLRARLVPFAASLTFAFVGHYAVHLLSALFYTFFVLRWVDVPVSHLSIFIFGIKACLQSMFVGILFTRWIPTCRPLLVVPLAACLEAGLSLVLPIAPGEPLWWTVLMMVRAPAATFLGCWIARQMTSQPSRTAVAQ